MKKSPSIRRKVSYPVAIVLILIHFNASGSLSFDFESWGRVLQQYVDTKGFVDYQSLSIERTELDQFLSSIKSSGPTTSPARFSRSQDELAYYINAYNALVFEGVLARGPEQKSVWSGLISGLNFFVRMDVQLDGKTTNLRNLENDIIRDKYRDPRIHAALNCASISCPRLPIIPFSGESLDKQLDAAMTEFTAVTSNVYVDPEIEKVFLSEIFDWFESDFIEYERTNGNGDPNLIDYINRYRAADDKINRNFSIDFIEYNKNINSQ